MAVGEPGAGLVGKRLQHGRVFARGGLEIAHADERCGPEVAVVRVVLDREQLVDLVDRFLRLVLRHQHGGIAEARGDEVGRQLDAAPEQLLGARHAALLERDLGEQLERVDVLGILPEVLEQRRARVLVAVLAIGGHRVAQDGVAHRLIEILRIRRIGALAAAHPDHLVAQRVPGLGESRIEVDGVLQRLRRAAVVAGGVQHQTELVMDLRHEGMGLRQRLQDRTRRDDGALPAQRDGEQEQRVGLLRVLAQDVARRRFRLRRIGRDQAPHLGQRSRNVVARGRAHLSPLKMFANTRSIKGCAICRCQRLSVAGTPGYPPSAGPSASLRGPSQDS